MTERLPQDLRALGYPVCDRGAAEIERLRAQKGLLIKRLRDAGLSTPFEAGDEQRNA